jgi:hypothetical protein
MALQKIGNCYIDLDEVAIVYPEKLNKDQTGRAIVLKGCHEAAVCLWGDEAKMLIEAIEFKGAAEGIEGPIREYEIWMEGFAATGQSGPAQILGSQRGRSFKEAVLLFVKDHPQYKKDFDPENLRIWGCQLYDNEAAARSSFG